VFHFFRKQAVPAGKQAVLFAMHQFSDKALEEFQRIKDACSGWADCFISYDNRDGRPVDQEILKCPHWTFSEKDIHDLAFLEDIRRDGPLIPGHNHWPVICFGRQRNYSYYWNIEYDVRFIGDWKKFFSHFRDAGDDFITAHIRTYKEEPAWYYWPTLSSPEGNIDRRQTLRSFNPIYRISHRALQYVDRMHGHGWKGHQEALIATLLYQGGFKIRDFGGKGRFVRWGQRNLFYIDSTNVSLTDGSLRFHFEHSSFKGLKNKLVHPVK